MLQSLLTELFGDARRLASVVVFLLAIIYISGFLIVNIYLGQFGVVRLELLQIQFIAAGVLFVFIVSIAGLSSTFLLVPVLELVNLADRLWESSHFKQYLTEKNCDCPPCLEYTITHKSDFDSLTTTYSGSVWRQATKYRPENLKKPLVSSSICLEQGLGWQFLNWLLQRFGAPEDIRPGGNWEQKNCVINARQARCKRCLINFFKHTIVAIFLALAIVIFWRLFFYVEAFSSQMMAYLLTWTGEGTLSVTDLVLQLEPLARLEGLGVFFICVLLLQANRLHRLVQRSAVILAIMLFLSLQVYSLIWFADRLYDGLPCAVGGGEPKLVQFLAKRDELQVLKELGIEIIPLTTGDKVGKTKVVQLIHQPTQAALPETYIVLPCPLSKTCRAVEFDSALVLGLEYCTSEKAP